MKKEKKGLSNTETTMKMADAISKLDIPEAQKQVMYNELMSRTMSEEVKAIDTLLADFEREKGEEYEKVKTNDRLYTIITITAIVGSMILILSAIYVNFFNQ